LKKEVEVVRVIEEGGGRGFEEGGGRGFGHKDIFNFIIKKFVVMHSVVNFSVQFPLACDHRYGRNVINIYVESDFS